jgi:hypothetical protein
MVMCSTVVGNTCKPISTTQIEFKDMYECTVYGYSYSEQIIIEVRCRIYKHLWCLH